MNWQLYTLGIAESGLLAHVFFVQHACGLLTIPTLLVCADATAHAQAQCRKGSSSHNSFAVECYNTHYVTEKAQSMCSREL